jgi:hypothetical protein
MFETSPAHVDEDINHLHLSKIYLKVHEHAESLGISLEKLEEQKLELIYSTLSRVSSQTRSPMPDPQLIDNLLRLANS